MVDSAYSSAVPLTAATPNRTAHRLSSMASTSAPAGIWLTRLQIGADGESEADFSGRPAVLGQVDRDERTEAGLHIGHEEVQPVETAAGCAAAACLLPVADDNRRCPVLEVRQQSKLLLGQCQMDRRRRYRTPRIAARSRPPPPCARRYPWSRHSRSPRRPALLASSSRTSHSRPASSPFRSLTCSPNTPCRPLSSDVETVGGFCASADAGKQQQPVAAPSAVAQPTIRRSAMRASFGRCATAMVSSTTGERSVSRPQLTST